MISISLGCHMLFNFPVFILKTVQLFGQKILFQWRYVNDLSNNVPFVSCWNYIFQLIVTNSTGVAWPNTLEYVLIFCNIIFRLVSWILNRLCGIDIPYSDFVRHCLVSISLCKEAMIEMLFLFIISVPLIICALLICYYFYQKDFLQHYHWYGVSSF